MFELGIFGMFVKIHMISQLALILVSSKVVLKGFSNSWVLGSLVGANRSYINFIVDFFEQSGEKEKRGVTVIDKSYLLFLQHSRSKHPLALRIKGKDIFGFRVLADVGRRLKPLENQIFLVNFNKTMTSNISICFKH
eukprot:GHVP01023487.1.p1 GENE.GHVP01023487.1~~GHVP01023487.1.p1  ORF type:complete len:137 (+),score=12.50 GHVP01023487.1:212-622(+)